MAKRINHVSRDQVDPMVKLRTGPDFHLLVPIWGLPVGLHVARGSEGHDFVGKHLYHALAIGRPSIGRGLGQ